MLSIGRLGRGAAAADYYLRQQAGCDLDYYTGRGERAGQWCGSGASALGLCGVLTPAGEARLAQLLEGVDVDGLVPPVWRAAPGSGLAAGDVLDILHRAAASRGCPVEDVVGDGKSLLLVRRLLSCVNDPLGLGRATPVRADTAGWLLTAAGLDPNLELRTADGADRYGRALAAADQRVDVRRPGLDLTFSAPKSVSVLYALGSGTVAGQVRAAHDAAVRQALAYMEVLASGGKRGHNGTTRVGSDGLIAVAFEHRSSRCDDPQLHTHVVTANLAHGEDGKWGAIDTAAIYREAKTVGYAYQTILRGELTRRLGVGWTPVTNGTAEISGLPIGLVRLFSQRRAAIVAELARVGRDDADAAQRATLATRPRKNKISGLRRGWAERAERAGYLPQDLEQLLGQHACPDMGAAAEFAPALTAPTGLTRMRSTFTRSELFQAVCVAIPAGAHVTIDALRALATAVVRDRDVCCARPAGPVRGPDRAALLHHGTPRR